MEINTALDAALIVLENGGSTNLAERTFTNILRSFPNDDDAAQRGVAAVWRTDFVAVSAASGEGPSSTVLRRVSSIGMSLFRASEAATLGERAARGELNGANIISEIDRIKKMAAPPIWVMVLAAACTAALFTQTAGGDYGALGVAFVAAGLGQVARLVLQMRKVGRPFNTFVAAITSALIATAGLRLGVSVSAPATLLGSIIYMVPGIALVNGFIDLVSDRHILVGVERLLHAFLTFMVLTLAIVTADALL
jgi:uncharacterized membrane protein YjjP (DUF1212 family)